MNFCAVLLFANVLPDFSQMQTGAHIADMYLYTILYGMYAIAFAIPCIFIVKNMFGKEPLMKRLNKADKIHNSQLNILA
jgi:hypothetical protein